MALNPKPVSYPVYLDYNATTPMDAAVIEKITSALHDAWGNASSNHSLGLKAKGIVDSSRSYVAQMVNAVAQDIVFTSGGTEVSSSRNFINDVTNIVSI
jgi:cysteine desulfurase